MPTAGTGPARIVLILQGHSHPQPLRFVGELEADRAVGPLVNFLVVGMPNIVVLPDIAHIANDHGLHACLMQRGDEPRGLLMFDIFNLVFDLLQLPFLGPDEPLAAFAALLHPPIDTLVQFGLQLVAVLDLRAQEPPVEDMCLCSIVSHRHMHLAQVNSCHLLTLGQGLWLLLLIGGYRFVLGSHPMDDHGLWQIPSPIQDERHVATAIGQSELAIRQAHSRTFVLDAKVPASLVRWPGGWISFTALPPTFETGKERLYTSIGCMRMQLVRGEQPLQVLLFEPDALMPHSTPKEH